MLKNPYVRIALVIVLVILFYYLVVVLARNVARADDAPRLSHRSLVDYPAVGAPLAGRGRAAASASR